MAAAIQMTNKITRLAKNSRSRQHEQLAVLRGTNGLVYLQVRTRVHHWTFGVISSANQPLYRDLWAQLH